jgi:sugar lactone lactonase YvrE
MLRVEDAFPAARSAVLAESPLWDKSEAKLIWIDMVQGDVFEAVAETVTVQAIGRPVMAVALAQPSGLCVVYQDWVSLPGRDNRSRPGLSMLDPEIRFNDAGCDPAGRLWIGTTALDAAEDRGSIGFLEADGSYRSVVGSLTLPNGVGWSPQGDRLYLADSGKNIILQAPYNSVTAEIGPVEPFIKIEPGVPDGLCVCSDGSLWVAQWGGGRVCRFDADGRLACELRLPVSQPTSCAVDAEGTLYITTSAYGLNPQALAREPLAGRVLKVNGAGPACLEPRRVAP